MRLLHMLPIATQVCCTLPCVNQVLLPRRHRHRRRYKDLVPAGVAVLYMLLCYRCCCFAKTRTDSGNGTRNQLLLPCNTWRPCAATCKMDRATCSVLRDESCRRCRLPESVVLRVSWPIERMGWLRLVGFLKL